jgi:hypothetical protein
MNLKVSPYFSALIIGGDIVKQVLGKLEKVSYEIQF